MRYGFERFHNESNEIENWEKERNKMKNETSIYQCGKISHSRTGNMEHESPTEDEYRKRWNERMVKRRIRQRIESKERMNMNDGRRIEISKQTSPCNLLIKINRKENRTIQCNQSTKFTETSSWCPTHTHI